MSNSHLDVELEDIIVIGRNPNNNKWIAYSMSSTFVDAGGEETAFSYEGDTPIEALNILKDFL